MDRSDPAYLEFLKVLSELRTAKFSELKARLPNLQENTVALAMDLAVESKHAWPSRLNPTFNDYLLNRVSITITEAGVAAARG